MLPRVAVALVLALATGAGLVLTGCQGGSEQPGPAPSSVEAFPEAPRMSEPLTVRLRPSLRRLGESGAYRFVGDSGPVVVARVTTAPSADHTSWGTTVVFAAGSADAVRRARDQAAGFGGVVVVTVGDDVVASIPPADLTPRRAVRFGLEKSEAWAVVDAYRDAQTRSKQGM
ncbi:hypothetical protein [Nocardioides sp. URHA0020]|uniref:hypothetical protein n=1 Tax=Nocardioides sp. URHA0020 TaxID=1380392 RepID=UPI000491FD4F|nr:hypothetical protein [Nocardioides sp. URHA0020]